MRGGMFWRRPLDGPRVPLLLRWEGAPGTQCSLTASCLPAANQAPHVFTMPSPPHARPKRPQSNAAYASATPLPFCADCLSRLLQLGAYAPVRRSTSITSITSSAVTTLPPTPLAGATSTKSLHARSRHACMRCVRRCI